MGKKNKQKQNQTSPTISQDTNVTLCNTAQKPEVILSTNPRCGIEKANPVSQVEMEISTAGTGSAQSLQGNSNMPTSTNSARVSSTKRARQVDIEITTAGNFSAQSLQGVSSPKRARQVDMEVPMAGTGSTQSLQGNSNLPTSTEIVRVTERSRLSVTQTQRSRLSGASRKKLQSLLRSGMELEMARFLCTRPWSEIRPDNSIEAVKRTHSDNSCRDLSKPQEDKTVCYPIGIFNIVPMTEEQIKMVLNAFCKGIDNADINLCRKLEFGGYSYRTGWVKIMCMNQTSRDWIIALTPELKLWPDAQLSTINGGEVLAKVFLPKSVTDNMEKAFEILRRQNYGLQTNLWKVLYAIEKEQGISATLSIDLNSAKTLWKNKGKASFHLNKVSFRLRGDMVQSSKAILGEMGITTYESP